MTRMIDSSEKHNKITMLSRLCTYSCPSAKIWLLGMGAKPSLKANIRLMGIERMEMFCMEKESVDNGVAKL